MAITISGENNNDKILAQDGVIDSISGFNIAGIITASSFTGDLTGDVTGNLTGNVTGNINNSTLLLQTGGTERLRITSNGNVGINKSNPSHKLEILNGSDSSNILMVLGADTTTEYAAMGVTGGNAVISGGGGGSTSTGIIFQTSVSGTEGEKVRITPAGNVGIGTDNPLQRLHVKQGSTTTPAMVEALGAKSHVKFQHNAGNSYTTTIGSKTLGSGNVGLTFDTGYNGAVQRMTIDVNGKVGIGTDFPDHGLHVYKESGDSIISIESTGNGNHSALEFIRTSSGGDSKGAGSIYVTGNTSASEAIMKFAVGHNVDHQHTPSMVIMGNGEVGIGTDNPQEILHIHENSTSPCDVRISNSEGYGFLRSDSNLLAYNAELHLFANRDRSEEYMRIRNDGKVIIGDTNSDALLGVVRASYNIAEFCNNNADATGAEVALRKDSSSPADGDTLGILKFIGDNDAGEKLSFAYITTKAVDVSDGTEDGRLEFHTRSNGTIAQRLRIAPDGKVKICHVDNLNPTEPLHVVATAVNQDIARFTGANKDRGLVISTSVSGSTNDAVINYNADSQNSVGQHVFKTDGAERVRIDNNGNLQVSAGQLTVGTTATTGLQLINDGTFGTLHSATLKLRTVSTERFRIDTTGRLIAGGTSAGTYHQDGDNLNIYSTGNTGMSIFSGTSSLGSLFFADDNNDVHGQRRGAIQYNHNGNYLALWTNAGEKLRIDSDGQLLSTCNNNGQVIHKFYNKNGTASSSAMTVEHHFNFNRTSGQMNLSAARIVAGKEREWVGAASNQDGFLAFYTTLNETPGERLRIDSSGRLKINTTSDLATNEQVTIKGGADCIVSLRSSSHADGNDQKINFMVGDATWQSGNVTSQLSSEIVNTSSGTLKANLVISANRGDALTNRYIIYGDSNVDHEFKTKTAASLLKLYNSGNVGIIDGNLVVANGHGIDFSATPDTHGTPSELLDDYEEGSYTPTMIGSGWSYTRQVGFYRKIGSIVHVSIWITASGGPNNGTTAKISLPFGSYSNSQYRGGISGSWDGANFDNTYTEGRNRSHLNTNTSNMDASFPFIDNGGWTSAGLVNSGLYDGFNYQGSGSYISNS